MVSIYSSLLRQVFWAAGVWCLLCDSLPLKGYYPGQRVQGSHLSAFLIREQDSSEGSFLKGAIRVTRRISYGATRKGFSGRLGNYSAVYMMWKGTKGLTKQVQKSLSLLSTHTEPIRGTRKRNTQRMDPRCSCVLFAPVVVVSAGAAATKAGSCTPTKNPSHMAKVHTRSAKSNPTDLSHNLVEKSKLHPKHPQNP